jgi:hypothetical protein
MMPDEQPITDEIVEEVHAARKKIAEECDYDFNKLLARCERMQAEDTEDLVYEVPKTEPEPQQTWQP